MIPAFLWSQINQKAAPLRVALFCSVLPPESLRLSSYGQNKKGPRYRVGLFD